ncbi:MAG: carboxypeptidase M32 [Gemmatimonadota bacterium]|nr:carboxypeptidase M32 [Gemmatimonadota bacterium]
MSKTRESYDSLIERHREAELVESCSSLLQWDQETSMPAQGTAHRAEQLAALAKLAHEKITDPVLGDLLAACEESRLIDDPLSVEAVNIREIRRSYDLQTRLPARLVQELARTTALAHDAWVQARENSEFELFRPWLEKIMALKREQAEALGYESSPYDALIDEYEPGEKEARLESLFSELRKGLVPLLEKIMGSGREPDTSFLRREFSISRQQVFGEMAAAAIGFDFRSGRLDEVVHPFCMGIGPGDTRITTRYDSRDFVQAFFGILHEAGHGIYEQGLEPEHYGAPMGAIVSLGIHESQSRLWENFIGRSRPFWEHFLPRARGVFHEALREVGLESFLKAVNTVQPSFIRVEADEVTYNLHVILRFELESALLSGDLPPNEVPGAWNEGMEKLLGIKVPDDSLGCLQDVHWSAGLVGYFPTYCLGNLYAAQLYAQARKDIPDLDTQAAAGSFSDLLDWLRKNIHTQGKRYRAGKLIEKVTGGSLSTGPLLEYMNDKYGELYGL